MKKTIVVAATLITLFYLWFTDTINHVIDDTDVSYGFKEKALVSDSSIPISFDSDGNEVIVLNDISLEEKKRLWNNSDLKKEMLALFPKFIRMKNFIEVHVESDNSFKELLIKHISSVEHKFIVASMSAEEARRELSKF